MLKIISGNSCSDSYIERLNYRQTDTQTDVFTKWQTICPRIFLSTSKKKALVCDFRKNKVICKRLQINKKNFQQIKRNISFIYILCNKKNIDMSEWQEWLQLQKHAGR